MSELRQCLKCAFAGLMALAAFSASATPSKMRVLSATVPGYEVVGVSIVTRREGVTESASNNSTSSSANGFFSVDDDARGVGTIMSLRKPGYVTREITCPCVDGDYFLTPTMIDLDNLSVELSWQGRDGPDLDAHLLNPRSQEVFSRTHYGAQEINFPIDQQSMLADTSVDTYPWQDSIVPNRETIRIKTIRKDTRYVFVVHNYSSRSQPAGVDLSNARPQVTVFRGREKILQYEAPPQQQGNLWAVFKITEGGEIVPINAFGGVGALEAPRLRGQRACDNGQEAIQAPRQLQLHATELNALGERSYARLDYSRAADFFTAAIEENYVYEQAQFLSNLGLVFEKQGKPFVALFLYRKAFAEAMGDQRNRLQASAHYNMGRVFEQLGQVESALREYSDAKHINDNFVAADQKINRDEYGRALARLRARDRK